MSRGLLCSEPIRTHFRSLFAIRYLIFIQDVTIIQFSRQDGVSKLFQIGMVLETCFFFRLRIISWCCVKNKGENNTYTISSRDLLNPSNHKRKTCQKIYLHNWYFLIRRLAIHLLYFPRANNVAICSWRKQSKNEISQRISIHLDA